MLSLNKLFLFYKKNLNIYCLSDANHPCKHFGTGPFVTNSQRPISVHVLAHKTNKPTRFSSVLPHTIDASTTPSSSVFVIFSIIEGKLIFLNYNTNLAIWSRNKYWFARIAIRLTPCHCSFGLDINFYQLKAKKNLIFNVCVVILFYITVPGFGASTSADIA